MQNKRAFWAILRKLLTDNPQKMDYRLVTMNFCTIKYKLVTLPSETEANTDGQIHRFTKSVTLLRRE